MTAGRVNLHATVIVVAARGILFTGPSGSGKSSLAFACLAEARAGGHHAALIGDDQVFIEVHAGGVIAERPDSIAGLIELRHSAIVAVNSQRRCVVDVAVLPVSPTAERLPDEATQRFRPMAGVDLPLISIPLSARAPLALIETVLAARHSPKAPDGHQI